ncbi:MAG TPA: tetratricopeptide repeat protein [Terriglobia bacterium]|nr:tetratricopeptide repeat protein [Terriglobia bacterium]
MNYLLLILLLQAAAPGPTTGQLNLDTTCDTVHSLALRQSAQAALDKNQYEIAARDFSEALRECPAQPEIVIELSQAQAHLRQFDVAISSLEAYLKQQPGSVPAQVALANVYFMAQRLAEAKREAEGVLSKDPRNLAAMEIEANAEYLLGNVPAAENRLIDLLDRYPNDEDGAYMLGRIYYQEGRLDQAVGLFERVLKVNPRSYKAYDNLGLCYEASGQDEKAERYFWAAIKLVDEQHLNDDWLLGNLAELYLKQGDAQKAFALASQAADRNPYSARNFYLGGKALCDLGKTDLCLNWLQRSSALDPNYPEPLFLLAHVYEKLGQEVKAKESLEKFREAKAKQPSQRK